MRPKPELTCVDLTPRALYFNRRKFLEVMGIAGAAAFAGAHLQELASSPRASLKS